WGVVVRGVESDAGDWGADGARGSAGGYSRDDFPRWCGDGGDRCRSWRSVRVDGGLDYAVAPGRPRAMGCRDVRFRGYAVFADGSDREPAPGDSSGSRGSDGGDPGRVVDLDSTDTEPRPQGAVERSVFWLRSR